MRGRWVDDSDLDHDRGDAAADSTSSTDSTTFHPLPKVIFMFPSFYQLST